MSLLHHITTPLKRTSSTRGGEYHGPCPRCGGTDRFRVQPEHGETGFFRCRMCQWSGDGITLLRDLYGLSFKEACYRLGQRHKIHPGRSRSPAKPACTPQPRTLPPNLAWQTRARQVCEQAVEHLWSSEGRRALGWLRGRGLHDDAIEAASLGFNPADVYDAPAMWGLSREGQVWTPRGITIPWVIGGAVWRVNVRRALPKDADGPRYLGPAGSSNALYNADLVAHGLPVVLVEGEFDAWSVMQSAHVPAVATGSVSGSRRLRWISRLHLASDVLVAFDSDEAGEKAARYWLGVLPNARRWRPYWEDANQMLRDGADLKAWVAAGLRGPSSLSSLAEAMPQTGPAISSFPSSSQRVRRCEK